MPSNLLLLPLLAGFLFTRICYFSRFRANSLEGYRLLLECAVTGMLFLVPSRAIIILLKGTDAGRHLYDKWWSVLPVHYSGTACLSVVLAVCLAFSLNLVQVETWNRAYQRGRIMRLIARRAVLFLSLWRVMTWKRQWRRVALWTPRNLGSFLRRQEMKMRVALNWATLRQRNELLTLLSVASQYGEMLSVSMQSRKFYIGYIDTPPGLDIDNTYFKMYPIRSGYRDPKDLTFVATTDYNQLQESEAGLGPAFIVLPFRDVISVNLFDPEVYRQYFQARP